MASKRDNSTFIAVVIPCYRVQKHILGLLRSIGRECRLIFVVDDRCPENSGKFVEKHCKDPRVRVLYHDSNQGVGGAVLTGYQAALEAGAQVIVKLDGDGQMDPALIPKFILPILSGEADYVKGNRFFDLEELGSMPAVRIFGNAALSFMAKLSTGYWNLFDPTNGYTAIHAGLVAHLPIGKISRRYFFETDILLRLNTLRAVVVDIPMNARYGDEVSSLKVHRIAGEFFLKHVRNFFKRIFYNYYLRDLSLASVELPLGLLALLFGVGFGGYHWYDSVSRGVETPIGTVMLAALPVIIGMQLLLGFLAYDIASVPKRARQTALDGQKEKGR
jgi:glycosyltransferase involved in cell wall biosynthesis